MAFFIQYDEAGNISGTVTGDRQPEHPRQLVLDTPVQTEGKKVNIETLELEDVLI